MRVKGFDDTEGTEIQMGPLIDCVFLLLIFFMVATTLSKPHRELEINLPHSAAAIKTKSDVTTLIIEATRDGAFYIDSQRMTKTLLHQQLRQAAIDHPHRHVRIDADRQTAAQHLVYLMDMLQFEGMKNVHVRTRD